MVTGLHFVEFSCKKELLGESKYKDNYPYDKLSLFAQFVK
jgi:hypothetical protein